MLRKNNDIDIFCHVIDNFGDAGVVFRLAKEYQHCFPEAKITIFTDGMAAFSALDSDISALLLEQLVDGIGYLDYQLLTPDFVNRLSVPELIIESFACDIPENYLNRAAIEGRLLINLDYLMAEEWVEGFHGKESLLGYPQLKKYFFMPGFTERTGGLLPESHLDSMRSTLALQRQDLLQQLLLKQHIQAKTTDCLIGTVFTYEYNFSNFLSALLKLKQPVLLLVMGNKSQVSWQNLLHEKAIQSNNSGHYQIDDLQIVFCDFFAQPDYDLVLNLADFNLVRGEDSLARAVRSGKPFVWHCYLQEEKYQLVKVEALLKIYQQYLKTPAVISELNDLFYHFNNRLTDNFTESTNENFEFFLNNLQLIADENRSFADFLRNNCNLVEKLLSFVRSLPE